MTDLTRPPDLHVVGGKGVTTEGVTTECVTSEAVAGHDAGGAQPTGAGGRGTEHYFAAQPATPDERRQLSVRLAGRDLALWTASGVFSHERLDLGTSVLLRAVPEPPRQGQLLDLGCGWGPIALSMALLAPAATVWAVDVNERALDLTRANARAHGLDGVRAIPPDQVPADIAFDAIWSNPPIRIGKAALHDLLLEWLPRLRGGGSAYLVVQRNLGADSLQPWLAGTLGPAYVVERHASAKGFRVLAVHRPAPDALPDPA